MVVSEYLKRKAFILIAYIFCHQPNNAKLNCIKSNFLFHHPNLDCRCLMPNALFCTPHTYVRVERQVNCSKVKVRKFLPQQQWKVNQTHMCPLIYDTFPPPILVVYLTSKEDSKWLGIHCCMTRLLSTHLERKTFFRRWKVKVYKKNFFFHSDASRNESQGCLSAFRATGSARRSVTQGFIATKKIKSG